MLEYLLFLLKAKTFVPNAEIINCSFTEQISITHISIKPTDLKFCGKLHLRRSLRFWTLMTSLWHWNDIVLRITSKSSCFVFSLLTCYSFFSNLMTNIKLLVVYVYHVQSWINNTFDVASWLHVMCCLGVS